MSILVALLVVAVLAFGAAMVGLWKRLWRDTDPGAVSPATMRFLAQLARENDGWLEQRRERRERSGAREALFIPRRRSE